MEGLHIRPGWGSRSGVRTHVNPYRGLEDQDTQRTEAPAQSARRDVRAPASVRADIRCSLGPDRLAQEPVHLLTVLEVHGAESER